MNRTEILSRAVTILGTAQKGKALPVKAGQVARPNQPAFATAGPVTRLNDSTFYINFRVDGMAGTNSLIDSNTKRLVGITNFDGDVLKAGRDLVIDSIKTVYTDVGTLPENADWSQAKAFPAALANAEIRLKQRNNVLIDLPVEDTRAFNSDDYRQIATTPTLKALETFELELEFPKGVAVAAGAPLFLRVSFRCIQAKK